MRCGNLAWYAGGANLQRVGETCNDETLASTRRIPSVFSRERKARTKRRPLFTASPHSCHQEFESRWAEQARPVVVSMFSASTSSRFKENSTEAPGPGAYQTSNNWEDASGAGVLTSKTDRFASRGALLTPTPAWPHSLLTLRA